MVVLFSHCFKVLKSLEWKKVSDKEAVGTIWSQQPPISIDINEKHVGELFGQKDGSPRKKISFFSDQQRLQKVTAALTKLKPSYEELKDACLALDERKVDMETIRYI